jgi:hypothetical protein
VKKRIASIPLYAGFLLWGAGALYGFLNHGTGAATYTLTLLGIVCLLVHHCVKNIETRLEAIETALELSRSAGSQIQPQPVLR